MATPTKQVRMDGKIHNVPADFTDEEIAQFLMHPAPLSAETGQPVEMKAAPQRGTLGWFKEKFYNAAEGTLDALPAAGGMVGGIIGGGGGAVLGGAATLGPGAAPGGMTGAVGGAGIGGMAGAAGRQIGRHALGFDAPQTPEAARDDIVKTGPIEGITEGLGRGVGRGIGLAKSAIAQKASTEIGGVTIPKTVGQTFAKEGGFTEKIEHYLRSSFVGRPLQAVERQQQEAAKQILANLARSPNTPQAVHANWAAARNATRSQAAPIYEALKDVPVPDTVPAARLIMQDKTIMRALGPKAKAQLAKLGTGGAGGELDNIAKGLGYKNYSEAVAKVGEDGFARFLPPDIAARAKGAQVTAGTALEVRSQLRASVSNAKDANDRRILREALDQFDAAINKGLSPEQAAQRAEANRLWDRSYIEQDIYNSLKDMLAKEHPAVRQTVRMSPINKLLSELREPRSGTPGTKSDLDVLFDNPADRKAFEDLGEFLTRTQRGGKGMGQEISHVLMAVSALSLPGSVLVGGPTPAILTGSGLASLNVISRVLARPGGAAALKGYMEGGPAREASYAILARLIAQVAQQEPARDLATQVGQGSFLKSTPE